MNGYVKTVKVEDKINKLMSFPIEKCKTIGTKIEDLKNIELNALLVYDHKYIKKQNKNIRR